MREQQELAAGRSSPEDSEFSLRGDSDTPAIPTESEHEQPPEQDQQSEFEDSESDLYIDGQPIVQWFNGPVYHQFNFAAIPPPTIGEDATAAPAAPAASSSDSSHLPDIPPVSPLPPRPISVSL